MVNNLVSFKIEFNTITPNQSCLSDSNSITAAMEKKQICYV